MNELAPTKVCAKCKRELPATTDYFYKSGTIKCGLMAQCKTCVLERTKKYQNEHKDKCKERSRRYREDHYEEIRKREIKYKEDHKEQLSEYRNTHKNQIHIKNTEYRTELKELVINHYGGKCAVCGETHLAFLNIDHIHNDGSFHKSQIGGSCNLYSNIVKDGFPPGYQVLCWNHNWLKHLEFMRSKQSNTKKAAICRRVRAKKKEKVLNHYGHACACCGITDSDLLGFDHINGKGRKHREEIGCDFISWVIENDFPKDLQLMCFNCNSGKEINGGTCPHESTSKDNTHESK